MTESSLTIPKEESARARLTQDQPKDLQQNINSTEETNFDDGEALRRASLISQEDYFKKRTSRRWSFRHSQQKKGQ
jgi:hypothetical protein